MGHYHELRIMYFLVAFPAGLTYYELHAPLMVLAQRQYAKGAISRTEMKALLDEAAENLESAIGMLKYEPEHSLEGKIHQVRSLIRHLCL